MELSLDNRTIRFIRVELTVSTQDITDVFAQMNSQALAEIVTKKRYERLARETINNYPARLTDGIGQFLQRLKYDDDPFYRRFLNSYGDQIYCTFAIRDHLTSRGIYAYVRGSEVTYIGRSREPFAKRINHGYGKIHPKNCYLDGQATNCHLNALIAEDPKAVSFYVAPMDDPLAIVESERFLIQQERPPWNIALAREASTRA